MCGRCENLARKSRSEYLPVTGVLAAILAVSLVPAMARNAAAITKPSITNPGCNEIWLMGAPYNVNCSNATDSETTPDSVTYTWDGTGSFPYGNVGQTVTYACSMNPWNADELSVTAVDSAGNEAVSDPASVTIVGVQVTRVGFGGGNKTLYQTPSDDTDPGGCWGDSTTAISNPVWDADSSDNNATNHACYAMGTSSPTLTSVRCRADAALTKGAAFSLRALGTKNWNWAQFYIGDGCRDSGDETLSFASYSLGITIKQYSLGCDWRYRCFAGANQEVALSSTSHDILLTYGAPTGDVPTVLRVYSVIQRPTGCSSASGAAASVWKNVDGFYNINGTPGVFLTSAPLVWKYGYGCNMGPLGTVGLDCNGVSKAFQSALNMLGVPNTGGNVVFVYPVPGGTVKETLSGTDAVTSDLDYINSGDGLRSGTYNFHYGFVDQLGHLNRYESCFKVSIAGASTAYYAPGAGTYGSAQDVLNDLVSGTYWYFERGDTGYYWPDDADWLRPWSQDPRPKQ